MSDTSGAPAGGRGLPDLSKPNATALGNLYRGLVAHWNHQDRLLWERTRLLVAVQGATLGVGFWAHDRSMDRIAFGVLAIGLLLTCMVFRLVVLDERDRRLAEPLLRWAGRQLMACAGDPAEAGHLAADPSVIAVFGMYAEPRRFGGGRIIRAALWLFVVVDCGFLALVMAGAL